MKHFSLPPQCNSNPQSQDCGPASGVTFLDGPQSSITTGLAIRKTTQTNLKFASIIVTDEATTCPATSEEFETLDFATFDEKDGSVSYCSTPYPVYALKTESDGLAHFQKRNLPCNSRWACDCPACAKRWGRKNKRRFIKYLSGMLEPMFVTLTLSYDKTNPNATFIDKNLWTYRNALLKVLKDWGYPVPQKWFGAIEYPNHVHMIWDCEFIPFKILQLAWKLVTGGTLQVLKDSYYQRDSKGRVPANSISVEGGSFHVNLQRLYGDVRKAIAYITKYMTKSNLKDSGQFIDKESYAGRKLTLTHGVKDTKKATDILYIAKDVFDALVGWNPTQGFTTKPTRGGSTWTKKLGWGPPSTFETSIPLSEYSATVPRYDGGQY